MRVFVFWIRGNLRDTTLPHWANGPTLIRTSSLVSCSNCSSTCGSPELLHAAKTARFRMGASFNNWGIVNMQGLNGSSKVSHLGIPPASGKPRRNKSKTSVSSYCMACHPEFLQSTKFSSQKLHPSHAKGVTQHPTAQLPQVPLHASTTCRTNASCIAQVSVHSKTYACPMPVGNLLEQQNQSLRDGQL